MEVVPNFTNFFPQLKPHVLRSDLSFMSRWMPDISPDPHLVNFSRYLRKLPKSLVVYAPQFKNSETSKKD